MNLADMSGKDARGSETVGRVKNACVFTMGVAIVVGIAFVGMMVLAAPDGIVMKTAVQAIVDQQQAIAVAYLK